MSPGQNSAGQGGRLLLDHSGRPFCGQLCPVASVRHPVRGSLLVGIRFESCESDLSVLVCEMGTVSFGTGFIED